ncbi:helix-turn-helix transcriptional regulator [Flavobacteriaceae bacterium LMO-SS05]
MGYAQKNQTSNAAFAQDQQLVKLQKSIAIEHDPAQYFSLHFQRMDLMPKIKNRHAYVLNYYHNAGYQFKILGHYRESLSIYKAFFSYYDTYEPLFSAELKKEYLRKRTFDYRGMAIAYQQLALLDSANFVHQKNLRFTDTASTIYKPAALNDYGMFLYGGMHNKDLALANFKAAFTITKDHFPSHFLLGSIRDNMAAIYLESGEIETAKALYRANFEFYQQIPNETSLEIDLLLLMKAGSKIVAIEIKQGHLKQAERAFAQMLNAFSTNGQAASQNQEARLEFLKAKQQILAASQKQELAYEVLQEVKQLSDSMNEASTAKKNDELLVINDLILDRSRANFKNEQDQKEAVIRSQRLKLWVVALLSLLALSVLVSLLVRRRQLHTLAKNKRQLAEQSLEVTALKNERLQAEIESKKRDLSDFAINLSQNQEWAKVLADKLEQLKTSSGQQHKLQLEEFEQDVRNKIKFDKDTKDFYERLDTLSDVFYSELHNKYPNLSKTEIRLCSLIRLKIDSYAIASLQNISVSSLNTSRYRLRKKLKLSKDDNLDEWIQFL